MSRRAILAFVRRTAVAIVGILVVLAGIAMLVLPGPGIGGILAGLTILSTEFSWAKRLRRHLLAKITNAVSDVRYSYRRRERRSSDRRRPPNGPPGLHGPDDSGIRPPV